MKIIHIFIIYSHNAGELKPVFKSRFRKTQEMIHLQLYTAPHFTIPFKPGIGINKARYKDLTGRHLNEEERKASPPEVHLP